MPSTLMSTLHMLCGSQKCAQSSMLAVASDCSCLAVFHRYDILCDYLISLPNGNTRMNSVSVAGKVSL